MAVIDKKQGTFDFSIRIKFTGIILFLIVLTVSWIIFQVRSSLMDAMSKQLELHGVSLATNIGAFAVDPVLTENHYELYQLIKTTMERDDSVRYIVIFNEQGEVLANSFGSSLPVGLVTLNRLDAGENYHIKNIQTDEGLLWDIAVRIGSGNYGTVRVGISGKQLLYVLNDTTKSIILTGAIVSLLGIVLAIGLTFVLTKPLAKLARAIESIAKGEFDQKAITGNWAGTEIVKLIHGFNYMVLRIRVFKEETEKLQKIRQQLLAKTISAQEEERKRIARELHDEASQRLAAITFGLQRLRKADDLEASQRLIEEMGQIINQTIDSLHGLAWQLRPSVLDDLGLEQALQLLCEALKKQYGIETTFTVYGDVSLNLCPEVKTAVYRIAQEAITNIVRHASASQAKVFVEKQEDLLILVVEDNGCGFGQTNANGEKAERHHLGLAGMKERADLIGATLIIDSQSGQGSTIYLKLPLRSEALAGHQAADC